MRRLGLVVAVVAALAGATAATLAQPAPPVPQTPQVPNAPQAPQSPPQQSGGRSMVVIAYVEPTNPAHRAHYDRLRRREVLEQVREFLSPLRLPRLLTVRLQSCGRANAFYSGGTVTICYEFLDLTRSRAPSQTTAEGVTLEDAIVAGFVSVLLHEISHAVFDILDVPMFGREEDAADQLAGFVMLHFGSNVARRMIAAKAHLWDAAASKRGSRNKRDYADTHGTEYQRFYNILCMAYGHDPKTFADYVKKNILPPARARRCRIEYRKVEHAFRTLLMPHIDAAALERVRKVEWLRPDDGRP